MHGTGPLGKPKRSHRKVRKPKARRFAWAACPSPTKGESALMFLASWPQKTTYRCKFPGTTTMLFLQERRPSTMTSSPSPSTKANAASTRPMPIPKPTSQASSVHSFNRMATSSSTSATGADPSAPPLPTRTSVRTRLSRFNTSARTTSSWKALVIRAKNADSWSPTKPTPRCTSTARPRLQPLCSLGSGTCPPTANTPARPTATASSKPPNPPTSTNFSAAAPANPRSA